MERCESFTAACRNPGLAPRTCGLLLALSLAASAPAAVAASFCVTTAAEFQDALDQAALDTGTDIDFVQLVGGTYSTADNGDLPFTYASASSHDLYVIGGYGPGCHSAGNPSVLDGANVSTVLETHAHNGATVLVDMLTIQHGRVPATNGHNGAGLRMNTDPGDDGSIIVSRCIIRDNHAASATFAGFLVVAANDGFVTFVNNLIAGNSAAVGNGAGGIYAGNSGTPYVAYNTVTGNTTDNDDDSGGLVFNGPNGGLILNNIFRSNTKYGLVLNFDATLISNDYGTLGGNGSPDQNSSGNLQVAADFVDAANDDYHLSGTSPLLGIGPTGLGFSGTDLDGHPLAQTGKVDLGAYQETIYIDGFDE
jgi:hypothetical protein